MDLGTFYDSLFLMPPNYGVLLETTPVVGVCSWRGIYAEASLDSRYGAEALPVWRLLEDIEVTFSGKAHEGWKGGEFFYDRSTRLWADPEGECIGYFPVGLLVCNRDQTVVVRKSHRDPYNL